MHGSPPDPAAKARPRRALRPAIIGWREVVGLPDLGLVPLRAKIDTGARTSALHASAVRLYEQDGVEWVAFEAPRPGAPHRTRRPAVPCRARVFARRAVRNTSGIPEERVIIRTRLALAQHLFVIELSLADRTDMLFPLIIGRTAVRSPGLLVDSGRSWLAGPPPPCPEPLP